MDTATVIYPSPLLTLEKHEFYSFERFAYSVISVGVPALENAKLTTNLTVTFDASEKNPWLLNAGISASMNGAGAIVGFKIATTSLTPPVLFGICHALGDALADEETVREWQASPAHFREMLEQFAAAFHEASKQAVQSGIANGVRTLMNRLNIGPFNLGDGLTYFDIVTRLIVNHEIAHAYVGQFSAGPLDNQERRAFEYIVDVVSAIWTYNKIVRLTPDSDQYREVQGASDYSESMRLNSQALVHGQALLLAFQAISGAVMNKGIASLEGGNLHPHGLLRCILQFTHLATLIESNQRQHFDDAQLNHLSATWHSALELFVLSGFVPACELEVLSDPVRFADMKTVERMIDEFAIRDVEIVKALYAGLKATPKSKR